MFLNGSFTVPSRLCFPINLRITVTSYPVNSLCPPCQLGGVGWWNLGVWGVPPIAPGWKGRWEQGSCDWGRKETQGVERKLQSSHGSGHGVEGWILGKGQRRSGDGAEHDPRSCGVIMGSCPVSPGSQRGQAFGRDSLAWPGHTPELPRLPPQLPAPALSPRI